MNLWSFASFAQLEGSADDDWADRVSHLYSVVLLLLFAVFVVSVQYVGEPIHCWCPAEFPSTHVSYAKSVCWVSNTYYIPTEDIIPQDIEKRQEGEITYYQWVPIIFLFMALLFKTPNLLWRMGNSYSGINMEKVVSMAQSTQTCGDPAERDTKLMYLATYMDRWLNTHRHYQNNVIVRLRQKLSGVFCFWLSRRDGAFLMGFYLFVKLLYCINIVGQFFLLNAFLSMDYNFFGFEVLHRLFRNMEVLHIARFPRVTLCDFLIRRLANVQRYTVQCVLPINLFNEKLFLVLWFWLFVIAVLAFFNYAHWMYWVLVKQNKVRFIKKYLRLTDQINTGIDRRLCRQFANRYLRDDGFFVLRVVAVNSSELALKDLVQELWKIFRASSIKSDPNRGKPPVTDTLGGIEDINNDLMDVPV